MYKESIFRQGCLEFACHSDRLRPRTKYDGPPLQVTQPVGYKPEAKESQRKVDKNKMPEHLRKIWGVIRESLLLNLSLVLVPCYQIRCLTTSAQIIRYQYLMFSWFQRNKTRNFWPGLANIPTINIPIMFGASWGRRSQQGQSLKRCRGISAEQIWCMLRGRLDNRSRFIRNIQVYH